MTCPACGAVKLETMPACGLQMEYDCAACGVRSVPRTGDCCVYCSYSDIICPTQQGKRDCCHE